MAPPDQIHRTAYGSVTPPIVRLPWPATVWFSLSALSAVTAASCRLGFDPNANPSASDAFVPPGFFQLSGTASGITSAGLVLQNSNGDAVAILQNGRFAFGVPIADGQTYAVALTTTPLGQDCVLTNAAGTVTGQPVTTIAVTCFVRGACPGAPLTFTADGIFTLPAGCTKFTVDAFGGGGAGGARNMGNAAAAGGRGGHATQVFINQIPGTMYGINIGLGGTCASTSATSGGYPGGGGGVPAGDGPGADGTGPTTSGGTGGAGSMMGTQPGGPGGLGRFGGGGGGGGGDTARGNSAGAATTFRIGVAPPVDYVVAGGGGGAGAADQNGDISGAGGAACIGYAGAPGTASIAGGRAAGGGGGGACMCDGGTCATTPDATGGLGGTAGQVQDCTTDQKGQPGYLTITFP